MTILIISLCFAALIAFIIRDGTPHHKPGCVDPNCTYCSGAR